MKCTSASVFPLRLIRLAFAFAAGAALFSPPTCDLRFKQSVIDGTEAFLFSTILNPEAIVQALLQAGQS